MAERSGWGSGSRCRYRAVRDLNRPASHRLMARATDRRARGVRRWLFLEESAEIVCGERNAIINVMLRAPRKVYHGLPLF